MGKHPLEVRPRHEGSREAGVPDETAIAQQHFRQKAVLYEQLPENQGDPHVVALNFFLSMIDHCEIHSVLDAGAGVGSDLLEIKRRRPDLRVAGVEPVAEMRAVGHELGMPKADLTGGDVLNLQLPAKSFDAVCAFALLHHVREPHRAISEMTRVARKVVFISDSNCYGGGTWPSRLAKQTLRSLRLWKAANWVRTRGRGYLISEGDGLFYPYSMFDDFAQLQQGARAVHLLTTRGTGVSPLRSASHVAFLAILK